MPNNKNLTYNFPLKCSESTLNKLIVCQENKVKFTAENSTLNEILKIKLEEKGVKCIVINGKICDYLLINKDLHSAFFIELKGSLVKEAIFQLENTIKHICNLQNNFISEKFTAKTAIILSNRNPLSATDTANQRKNFKKNLNTDLIFKKNIATEKIS